MPLTSLTIPNLDALINAWLAARFLRSLVDVEGSWQKWIQTDFVAWVNMQPGQFGTGYDIQREVNIFVGQQYVDLAANLNIIPPNGGGMEEEIAKIGVEIIMGSSKSPLTNQMITNAEARLAIQNIRPTLMPMVRFVYAFATNQETINRLAQHFYGHVLTIHDANQMPVVSVLSRQIIP